MLQIVKLALRRTDNYFDNEIQLLIDDCIAELKMLGINFTVTSEVTSSGTTTTITDSQIKTTIIAYCKWKFGDGEDATNWQNIYNDKVSKLKIASTYKEVPNG